MNYFVTGGTGFIGQNLIEELFERKRQATVYVLVRSGSRHKLDRLKQKLGRRADRLIPITGDLTRSMLGIPAAKRRELKGKISHVYHLGAVYDLGADADTQISVNVNGTRNTVRFAEDVGARKFHLVSSIAGPNWKLEFERRGVGVAATPDSLPARRRGTRRPAHGSRTPCGEERGRAPARSPA